MQALYRKYRSRALAEVVGQEHITEALASAIKHDRISHAYLFTGPRGVGKTSVARILAYAINKLPYTDEQQLDIIEIDAASNRRIDDIRELRDKVHIAPVIAPYKVYIIDEVHMLTGESFNALLKTLEEPPSHVVFILATTEAHKLPATIISRTQRYNFRPVDSAKVSAHLRSIADKEHIKIDDEALGMVAEYGDGSFRDSISLLDQLANVTDGTITSAVVEQTLGLAPHKALDSLMHALTLKDSEATVTQLNSLWQEGVSVASLLPQLLRAMQAAAASQPELYRLIDELIDVPRAFNPQIKLLATLASYTLSDPTKQAGTKQAPVSAQAVKPVLDISVEPALQKMQVVAASTGKAKEIKASVAHPPLHELTAEQWSQVLAQIKATSAPLQSVFRQAQPIFDADTQRLVLRFKYQLHGKKAEDSKARNVLTRALVNILGSAPTLVTEISTDSQPPEITEIPTKAAELDETAQSVATLMGGGEPV